MLAKFYHRLLDVLAFISAIGILFITLGVSADVILRYLTGQPIAWMFDVSQYALLYIPCLGMAWLARERGHIAITTFIEMASPRKVAVMRFLTTFAAGFTCLVIAFWGWQLLWDKYQSGSVAVQAIVVPEVLIYWVIPVGFSTTAFEFFRQLWGKPYQLKAESADKEVQP